MMNAPSFSLIEYGTNQYISLDDFTGQNVMLTFWASWCLDCHRDLPHKQRLYTSMTGKNIIMLTINVTGREGVKDDGLKFIENHGFTFPVLRDKGTKTYDAYQCNSVPQTILLDRDHEIKYRFDDQDDFIDIFQALGKLIN